MEPIFENRYVSTHHMMAEFGRKYAVGPRMPILVVFWVMYLLTLIPVIRNPEIFADDGFFFLSMGAVFLALSFMPHLYAWSARNGAKKQNDNVMPETAITFGDTIELHEGMVHITVEYRKIVKTVRLKHSYMLMTGKRNGVMLRPDAFTKGTFEECKAFLREKCPDLKVVD